MHQVARVLIVGDSQRGLRLAGELLADGHAVRVVTEVDGPRREAIEGLGAEAFLGTPVRLASMRGALEHVTIACWLLAGVEDEVGVAGRSGGDHRESGEDGEGGESEESLLSALHGPRLERFVCDAIDSTLRGFVYEAGGSLVPAETLAEGRRIVLETAALNSIPVAILTADPLDSEQWLSEAVSAIRSLLGEPAVRL